MSELLSDLGLREPAALSGPARRSLAKELAFGWAYWAAFLLALEPGNVVRAAGMGQPLAFGPEALRILVASLLGAATAPLMLAFARRFPIEGRGWLRRAALHAAGVIGLSLVLIPISCGLAEISIGSTRVGDPDVGREFVDNGLLLVFVLAGFTAIAHARLFVGRGARAESAEAAAPAYLRQIAVKVRGGLVLLPLDEVDWIETQGNYQALHVGGATHLVRETSARLEGQLDPERFARIHRRVLVAVDRVRALVPLGGGDAELTLVDGATLRLSRSYRERIQARLEGASASRKSPL